jgi:hypothetical protein
MVQAFSSGSFSMANGICFDFHGAQGIVTAETTAVRTAAYGQIIPPIVTSSGNQFVLLDSLGQPWIPTGTTLSVAGAANGVDPTGISSWIPLTDASNVLRAFDSLPFTACLFDQVEGQDVTWLRITLPEAVMAQRLTNTLIVHPFPDLGGDWDKIILQSSTGGTNTITPYPTNLMKSRFFFTPTALQAIYLGFTYNVSYPKRGLYHIGSYLQEFQDSAILTLDTTSYNPGETTSGVTIYSPSTPAPIPTYSTNSAIVTIPLSTLATTVPQVITGVQVLY